MAASDGQYRVWVFYDSSQCDVSCDKQLVSGSVDNAYFDHYSTPVVTFTFTPKDGYAIQKIEWDNANGCTAELIGNNKVKITSIDSSYGNLDITVTMEENINDLSTLLTGIADAIRSKDNSTGKIPAKRFKSRILAIQTGDDTSDATAAASDILSGKTAYVGGKKVTGTIQSQAAQTITPGTANKTIAAKKYLSGTQTIKGDANLKAENIKKNVTIFNVTGTYETPDFVGASVKIGLSKSRSAIMPAATSMPNEVKIDYYRPGESYTGYQTSDLVTIPSTGYTVYTVVGSVLHIYGSNPVSSLVDAYQLTDGKGAFYPGGSDMYFVISGPNAEIILEDQGW